VRQIALSGSLTEAAEMVNSSPSAASRLHGQLADEIGLTLFSRTRRRLELTEEGQQFYAQIENTLIVLDEIPKISHEIRRRTQDLFSVVAAAPLANGLAVQAPARMRADGVSFECTLNVASRFEIESRVAARGFNIGLISLPVQNATVSLDVVPFLEARVGGSDANGRSAGKARRDFGRRSDRPADGVAGPRAALARPDAEHRAGPQPMIETFLDALADHIEDRHAASAMDAGSYS
jgi:DNA-binding transcriptional LysR family regulator